MNNRKLTLGRSKNRQFIREVLTEQISKGKSVFIWVSVSDRFYQNNSLIRRMKTRYKTIVHINKSI